MTDEPKKELTADEYEDKRAFSRLYKHGSFTCLLNEMMKQGIQIDKRVLLMSVVFLLMLIYCIPSVKTELQGRLWLLSAVSFSACLWLMILLAKFSTLHCYTRLEELIRPVKKAKPLPGIHRIEYVCMFLCAVGGLSFISFIISVFQTGGF